MICFDKINQTNKLKCILTFLNSLNTAVSKKKKKVVFFPPKGYNPTPKKPVNPYISTTKSVFVCLFLKI